MSAPTWTPGPWHATEPNGWGTRHIRDASKPPLPIAEVLHFGPTGSGPNAHLIETAPELYEALEACAGDLIAFVDALERSAAADPRVAAEAARFAAVMLERIDNARAVLAKARGEVSHG